MIRLLPPLLVFVLWLFCLVDVINSRDGDVRNLSKTVWVFIVLLFPLVGSIAWLVAGRPQPDAPLTRSQGAAPSFPEYDRRGRFAAADPEKDDDFLKQVRERAEQQRRRYEAEQRAAREKAEQEKADRKNAAEETPDEDPTAEK